MIGGWTSASINNAMLPNTFQVVIINLGGSFFLAQAAARQMRAQDTPGRILLISSVLEQQTFPEWTVYGMTKHGIEMLAHSIGIAPRGA